MGGRVWLAAPHVGRRVDQEGEVVSEDHAKKEGDDEHPQHAARQKTEGDGGRQIDHASDQDYVAMLPPQDSPINTISFGFAPLSSRPQ